MTTARHAAMALVAAIAILFQAGPAGGQAEPGDSTAAVEPASGQGAVHRAPRQSWTADRRAFTVGDVITVLIDEQTIATASSGDYAADQRFRDLAANVSTSSESYGRAAASLGSVNDAESRQRGEATRRNRFVGEITVRVVGIEGGLLRIEGSRRTAVDRNIQEMTITGWVRPQDVSSSNLVESWRIGDANLNYTSSGDLGKPRGGIITRLLGAIWP